MKISQSGSHLVSSSLELKEGFVNVGLTVLGRANGLAQDTEPCGDFWGLALVRRSRVLGFNVLECAKDVELVICGFLALGLTLCHDLCCGLA